MAAALPTALLLAAIFLGLPLAGCGGDSTNDRPDNEKGGLLFVLNGKARATEARIELEDSTFEWFTDTPRHRAGFADVRKLVAGWQNDRSFDKRVPNAVLIGRRTDAVLELRDPEADRNRVSFAFKRLQGEVDPGSLGEVTLFVDALCIQHAGGLQC